MAYQPSFDVLIIPRGEEICGERAQYEIRGVRATKLFAFVGVRRVTDDFTRKVLEMVAGPVIVSLGTSERELVHIVVPAPSGRVGDGTSVLERKRALVWNNPSRNALIASMARALADGDERELDGTGFPDSVARSFVRECTRGRRVAVLVESTEHARALRPRLPDWAVMDAVQDPKTEVVGLTGRGEDLTMRLRVTLTRAAREPILADIVIRASGRSSPHEPRTLFDELRTDTPALLVDLDDPGYRPGALEYSENE